MAGQIVCRLGILGRTNHTWLSGVCLGSGRYWALVILSPVGGVTFTTLLFSTGGVRLQPTR